MSEASRILEPGVIGDIIGDESWVPLETMLGMVRHYRLTSECFETELGKTAFKVLMEASKTCKDDRVLLRSAMVEEVGVAYAEEAISNVSKDPVIAELRIKKLARSWQGRVCLNIAHQALNGVNEDNASAQEILGLLHKAASEARKAIGEGRLDESVITLSEIGDPTPEEKNPDALIQNGWLRKGHGMVLVSSSGVGKSVLSMQIAYAWARGLPIFGICPLRPLKIGIIQTEDDLEEMREFRQNMKKGCKEILEWTDDQIKEAEENILTPAGKVVVSGEEFIRYFTDFQLEHKCDLVIVNPLQGVCGCDIADNAELRHFIREQLDPVINAEDAKCAVMIVHHTNKPPTGDRRQYVSDVAAEYCGAGGAELTNWMRAMLAIFPTRKKGVFDLVAAKRGQRLEWKVLKDDRAVKPHKWIAHSSDMIFWKEVPVELPAKKKKEDSDKRSSDAKGSDQKKSDAENLASIYKGAIASEERITLSKARDLLTHSDFKCSKRGKDAHAEIMKNPQKYGLQVIPTGKKNEKVITTAAKTK